MRCGLRNLLRFGLTSLAGLALLSASSCSEARASLRERITARRNGADARPILARVDKSGPAAAVEVKRNILYAPDGPTQDQLDLYLPQGTSPHPIALYFHGGGWVQGSKSMGKGICEALARRGYLAASVDYRLADAAPWPAQIQDCQTAVRWLQAHGAEYGGEPVQMVVTGGSAGGQLALSLACGWGDGSLRPSGAAPEVAWPDRPIKACCSWYGPTDMTKLGKLPRLSWNLELYLGQTKEQRELSAAQASPILYIDKHDPPVLFIHGTKDPLVPVAQSRTMHSALQAAGVKTDIIEVQGGSHGILIAKPPELAQLAERMIDWFDQQLGRTSSS